jgi:hypothetical protein
MKFIKTRNLMHLSHLNPHVHKDGLHEWNEVATTSLFLFACNL